MLRKPSSRQSFPIVQCSLVLALAGIALPSGLLLPATVQAVSTESTGSATGAATTNPAVRIDGSGSMVAINTALIQQNPATAITAAANGTTAGLQALRAGKVDLAAIGRDLNDAEKAEGLVLIPIQREKVAMIVGSDNPYSASMTK
jgi:phosphate transport system substrate-binding protein